MVVGLVALAVLLALGARCADGPLGPIAGGPLESGALVREPVTDWSFVADVEEVELQLLDPPRSRTVWILVHEGEAYIPCGFLDVPLWKQWPYEALRDGRALVRAEDRRYPVRLERVEDSTLRATLSEIAAEKYGLGGGEPAPADEVWYFRLEWRTPQAERAARASGLPDAAEATTGS